MLFHVTWEFIEMTESSEPRHLAVFAQWQPPAGADFTAFYNFADNSGGVAILDVDCPATLARTTAPWVPWMRFSATPIEPVESTIAIRGEAVEFRASVSA
jgi:hypothetical protein